MLEKEYNVNGTLKQWLLLTIPKEAYNLDLG